MKDKVRIVDKGNYFQGHLGLNREQMNEVFAIDSKIEKWGQRTVLIEMMMILGDLSQRVNSLHGLFDLMGDRLKIIKLDIERLEIKIPER